MSSDAYGYGYEGEVLRPTFHIGQHDSNREQPLSEVQYGQLLNAGVRGPQDAFFR